MGDEPRVRISIFLNVFDVHINRIPISGRIRKAIYHPGKFFNASLDKASEFNERNTLVIDLQNGGDLAVVQIAGLIARRIRCDVTREDAVITGSQYGIIRFGSRTDIYLPIGAAPLVIEGQRVLGGETVIADLESNEMARHGTHLKNQRLKVLSISAVIPNIATLLALCSGMTAIRMAMLEKWELAVVALLVAAFLDGMDGRLARLLGSTSRFGAELDSFSDLISFGAAPAIVMYMKGLHKWGETGWCIVLFFTVCMTLRLARFNTRSIEGDSPTWSQGFFTGVPAPAAAVLTASAVYSHPWLSLSMIGFVYLGLIPFSVRSFRRVKNEMTRLEQEESLKAV
eukprot:gene15385-15526_t